jgi:hypothetical protein
VDARDLIRHCETQNIPIFKVGNEIRFNGEVPPALLKKAKAVKAQLLELLPTEPPARREILEPEPKPLEMDSEEIALPAPTTQNEPKLSDVALHGLIGDIVQFLEPTTEAHRAGLLISLLLAIGNALGRGVYVFAGNSRHHANLDAVLVGPTGEGRKGTSWDAVKLLLQTALSKWFKGNVKSGLSSGEGLIWAVRDEIKRAERVGQGTGSAPTYEDVVVDSGIDDKRVLVLEGEFAQVLNVLAREGNTLGVVMRNAWDGSNLSILTKASAAQATDPHVSILGHITAEELHAKLTSTDAHNGVGNRILWVYVRRSKCLAFTPRPDQDVLEQLAGELAQRITNAQTIGLVEWADDAAQAWEKIYPSLTAGRAGLVGSLTARAAPQVIRMAMLYAAIDGLNKIYLDHLKAALAFWQYCEASVNFVFKARSGDPVKAKVQQYLEAAGEAGMTRSGIGEALGNHVRSAELELVLTSLEQDQIISRFMVKPAKGSGGGRPREMFRAVKRAG